MATERNKSAKEGSEVTTVAVVDQESFGTEKNALAIASPMAEMPVPSDFKFTEAIDPAIIRSAKQMVESLKDIAKFEQFTVTSDYHEFEEGEEMIGVYIGKTKIPSKYTQADNPRVDEDGKIEAVRILTTENKTIINASSMLVGTLEEMRPGTPIRIVYEGKAKTQGGKYQFDKFEVNMLVRASA